MKEIIKERKFKYISFFWFIISIQFIIGNNLQTKGYSINSFTGFLLDLIKIIFLTIGLISIHYSIIEVIQIIKEKEELIKKNEKDKPDKEVSKQKKCDNEKYKILKYYFIIMICWLPVLLAFCPIISNYDGPSQIRTFVYSDLNVNTRQPIIHTILLSTFYLFGYKYLNSCSSGMLLFSIFQMSVMALIFSYTIKFVEEKTNKKWIRNLSIIFYALFPFNQLFPLMTTKDVLFAGFVLLFVIKLYKILEEKHSKLDYILIIIIAVIMLLFRNNAVYAIIVCIPFVIITMLKNKQKLIKILISSVVIILLYQVCFNTLIYVLKAEKDTNQEKMSVFSQATAKICNERLDDLTEEEKEKITFYFGDYNKLGSVYESNISDRTKELTNCENVDNNKFEFLKFMIELASKYPREFIDSFLNTIRGYWYICDNSFNKISNEEYPYLKGNLELTFIYMSEDEFGLVENSQLPYLQHIYRAMFCHNDYEKIPVLYVIFQPAIYFYIVLAFLLYSIYNRDKTKIIISVFLFAYFATCFLGPVALIRYIYAIIVCVPFIIGMKFIDKNQCNN